MIMSKRNKLNAEINTRVFFFSVRMTGRSNCKHTAGMTGRSNCKHTAGMHEHKNAQYQEDLPSWHTVIATDYALQGPCSPNLSHKILGI